MIVAPSLLAADPLRYGAKLKEIEAAGAEYLHLDVMDGHFVNNLSFGPTIISGLRKGSDMIFDVHLMIDEPQNFVERFIGAGADIITVHLEATKKIEDIKKLCHVNGIKFGIAICPDTQISDIVPFADGLDLLLIMSIYPGGEGQEFMAQAKDRIAEAAKVREENDFNYLISVDGGVNDKTVVHCKAAGADVVVSGGYLFSNTDKKSAISSLKFAME